MTCLIQNDSDLEQLFLLLQGAVPEPGEGLLQATSDFIEQMCTVRALKERIVLGTTDKSGYEFVELEVHKSAAPSKCTRSEMLALSPRPPMPGPSTRR